MPVTDKGLPASSGALFFAALAVTQGAARAGEPAFPAEFFLYSFPAEAFPYCLAIRTQDLECVRDTLSQSWQCQPDRRLSDNRASCVFWDSSVKSGCDPDKRNGFYRPEYSDTKDSRRKQLLCFSSTLLPEAETIAELPTAFATAARFSLPKQKFPASSTVRMRTHECFRDRLSGEWDCKLRPALPEPVAADLPPAGKVEFSVGPLEVGGKLPWCGDLTGWINYRYVTANINPLTNDAEPVVRCEVLSSVVARSAWHVPIPDNFIFRIQWIRKMYSNLYLRLKFGPDILIFDEPKR